MNPKSPLLPSTLQLRHLITFSVEHEMHISNPLCMCEHEIHMLHASIWYTCVVYVQEQKNAQIRCVCGPHEMHMLKSNLFPYFLGLW